MVEAYSLRCNQIKISDRIIKCCKIKNIRKEFAKDLVLELVNNKPEEVYVNAIIPFVQDAIRYNENKEEEDQKAN